MTCTIEHDEGSWIDDDLAEAAQEFAERCDRALPGHSLNLVLREPDSRGWVAYLRGHGGYGEETVAMVSRSCFHFEDTWFLSDEEEDVLGELVAGFARAISPSGETFDLHT